MAHVVAHCDAHTSRQQVCTDANTHAEVWGLLIARPSAQVPSEAAQIAVRDVLPIARPAAPAPCKHSQHIYEVMSSIIRPTAPVPSVKSHSVIGIVSSFACASMSFPLTPPHALLELSTGGVRTTLEEMLAPSLVVCSGRNMHTFVRQGFASVPHRPTPLEASASCPYTPVSPIVNLALSIGCLPTPNPAPPDGIIPSFATHAHAGWHRSVVPPQPTGPRPMPHCSVTTQVTAHAATVPVGPYPLAY